jgi:hypothetical protein
MTVNHHRGTETQRFKNKEFEIFLLCLCVSVVSNKLPLGT